MLLDAHNHLHDARLDPWRAEIMDALRAIGVAGAVVNGTREGDWESVAALAGNLSWVMPSFGLHPWHVNARTPEWREALAAQVSKHPGCGIGEIGLDRWIENYDLPAQLECFRWQLELAARENLPATIHCLKAWGALWEAIESSAVPERGFLIHAYGGPAEMVSGFVKKGAYFSFSPYFLHARKAPQREVFRTLPAERILVETDAPDMAPPPEADPRPLMSADGRTVNHPANLDLAYKELASLRGWTREETEAQVSDNFARLFGRPKRG
jgi:TatD DNase family protein